MATSSFFYGGSSAPEQNTVDQLIDSLNEKIAAADEDRVAAQAAATQASASASGATSSASSAAASASSASTSAMNAADAARLTAGTVTTGAAGTSAAVSITGVAGSQVLNLTIPRGDIGATGPAGPQGPQGIQGPAGTGTGDVVGPASSTDNAIARFDGTTGKMVQNSGVTVSDADLLTTPAYVVSGKNTPGSGYNDTYSNGYWIIKHPAGNIGLSYSEGGSQGTTIFNGSEAASLVGETFVSKSFGFAFSPTGGNADLKLTRDAANTLAQRNGTNAQTFRTYGTYTDASNYRRLSYSMTTAGVAEIKPEGAGTGASGNVLHISGLPTSNPGPGILWNDAGTVKVGT